MTRPAQCRQTAHARSPFHHAFAIAFPASCPNRSVVCISTSRQVRDPRSRDVRSIPRGTGSGIIGDDQGHVITDHHVIAGASAARVRRRDGKHITVDATLAASR
jgi:S1-C subfamily serine protease